MRIRHLLSVCLLIFVSSSNAAKILTIFSTPTKSHCILGQKLVEGLIDRGHEVTFASPFPVNPKQNLTHFHLKQIFEYQEAKMKDQDKLGNTLNLFERMITITRDVNQLFWTDPNIEKLLKEKTNFDLLISLTFFNDAILGIGHHLGVPTVVFTNVGSFSLFNNHVANPTMPYSSDPVISISTDGFLGRLATVSGNFLMSIFSRYLIEPINQELLDKYLPNSPPLRELQKNVSIVLANSHVSIEPPKPYVPSMIQIGGFHVQNTKPLPADIKEFLDEANDGAILFTLGSMVQFEMIAEEKRGAILKVLEEMTPMRVVLKAKTKIQSLPKNIMVKEWLPQADILAHPNIKLFISHGGLGGTTESVYHGVPILGIPFYGDQIKNLKEAKSAEYAEFIEPQDLTEDSFRKALKNILYDKKYEEAVAKRSSLMKYQLVKPMDIASFWIEHVIKFGGGSHLRNAGVDLEWYQIYMVDIYVFYTIVLFLFLTITVKVFKFSKKILCGKPSKVKTS